MGNQTLIMDQKASKQMYSEGRGVVFSFVPVLIFCAWAFLKHAKNQVRVTTDQGGAV